MRLSLCLIARNEQHNLPRALSSFDGLCDEIIVADTGSTDQTVDLARKHNARVITFPWCDDFAAARNFCIEHARGQWIFWLDADEALIPESRPLLEDCLARADVAGWYVLRQDLVRSDRIDLFTEMWQLRLFRRDQFVRFIGRCHPDFDPPLPAAVQRRGMSVLPSALRLRHWGYVAEVKAEKLRRSAHLLKMELADRPGQLYYEIELGRTLMALGDREGAQQVLKLATAHLLRHRNDPAPPSVMAAALLECLMSLPRDESRRLISDDEVFELCKRWFPRSAPLLWAMSRLLFDAGDFSGAAGFLKTLLQLGHADNYDKSISFDPRLIREDAALNLAVCLIREAELDEAEQLLTNLLSTPRRPQAEQNLAVIQHLRKSLQAE